MSIFKKKSTKKHNSNEIDKSKDEACDIKILVEKDDFLYKYQPQLQKYQEISKLIQLKTMHTFFLQT